MTPDHDLLEQKRDRPVTGHELRTGELTLHYEDDGDPDQPPVLFLHGITSSSATWSWVVPHLAGDHRIVRLDFRGHGRSGRSTDTYAWPGYVADATAICEQVFGQPAIVVGHSLGGATAAGLAQTRPDLVRGVVLEDPALGRVPTPENRDVFADNTVVAAFEIMRGSVPHLQSTGVSTAELADMLRKAPSPSGPPFADVAHDGAIVAMAEAMLQLDITVLDPIFDGTHAPVFDPHRELPVPGIVVAGDPAQPDTATREPELALLAEHSPAIEQRVVSGVGHLIHDDIRGRDAVLAAVRDLLDRI